MLHQWTHRKCVGHSNRTQNKGDATPSNYLLASMAVSDVFTIMMFAAHRFAFSQHVLNENFGHLVFKKSASLQAPQ